MRRGAVVKGAPAFFRCTIKGAIFVTRRKNEWARDHKSVACYLETQFCFDAEPVSPPALAALGHISGPHFWASCASSSIELCPLASGARSRPTLSSCKPNSLKLTVCARAVCVDVVGIPTYTQIQRILATHAAPQDGCCYRSYCFGSVEFVMMATSCALAPKPADRAKQQRNSKDWAGPGSRCMITACRCAQAHPHRRGRAGYAQDPLQLCQPCGRASLGARPSQ